MNGKLLKTHHCVNIWCIYVINTVTSQILQLLLKVLAIAISYSLLTFNLLLLLLPVCQTKVIHVLILEWVMPMCARPCTILA